MSTDKAMILEASTYEDLPKHSKVFNKSQMEYHLWIYLNPEDVRGCYFVQAEEIGPNADNSTIYPDTFVREGQCWIRVNFGYISKNPGKHTIKLSFVEKMTSTDFSLYVSFYVQDDNPDKPYVYMNKEQEVLGPDFTPPSGFTIYGE